MPLGFAEEARAVRLSPSACVNLSDCGRGYALAVNQDSQAFHLLKHHGGAVGAVGVATLAATPPAR